MQIPGAVNGSHPTDANDFIDQVAFCQLRPSSQVCIPIRGLIIQDAGFSFLVVQGSFLQLFREQPCLLFN
jgi:hypothetical protein